MGTPPEPRRLSDSELASLLLRLEAQRLGLPYVEPPPPRSAWQRWGTNVLLFVLTVVSVYLMGGLALALGLLSILFAHEMGHYLACVRYRVDATLPYFIPAPLVSFVGTLGAFIRIRAPGGGRGRPRAGCRQ